jgi:hypothetical protein
MYDTFTFQEQTLFKVKTRIKINAKQHQTIFRTRRKNTTYC